jgi:hypothetical protein
VGIGALAVHSSGQPAVVEADGAEAVVEAQVASEASVEAVSAGVDRAEAGKINKK